MKRKDNLFYNLYFFIYVTYIEPLLKQRKYMKINILYIFLFLKQEYFTLKKYIETLFLL